jgi:hypothetical protein
MQEKNQEKLICPNCGFVGQRMRFSKGSYLLEMFLWAMFFVPGALYTTWRAFNEFHACPICLNREMAPLGSEFGKKIFSEKQRLHQPISKKEQWEFFSKIFGKN